MDVTHSTQKPSALGNIANADGFFFEVHQNPEKALSDGPNMVYLKDFKKILESIK